MGAINFDFKANGIGDVEKAFTSVERAAQKYKRTSEEAARSAKKAYGEMATANMTAEQKATKEALKASKQKISAYEKAAKAARNAAEKETEFQLRQYEKQANAHKKMLDKRAKDSQAMRSKIMGGIGLGLAGAALGFGAIAASSIKTLMSQDLKARKISVANRGYGEAGLDPQKILDKSASITSKNGTITGDDALAGIGSLAEKVGMDKSMEWSDAVATAAQAAGTSMEDMADLAGDLAKKLNITDLDTFKESLAALVQTSKEGGVDFNTLGDDFGKLLIASKGVMDMADDPVKNIKTIQGLTNLGMAGSGKRGEATAATEAFLNGMGDAATVGRLSQNGIKTTGKSPKDVIMDIIKSTGGDMSKITALIGKDAAKLFTAPAKEYSNALKNGEDATKKLSDGLDKSLNAVSSYTEIQRDAADIGKSSQVQWDAAMENVKNAFLPLIPAITQLAPHITSIVKLMADVTKFYAEIFGNAINDSVDKTDERLARHEKEKKENLEKAIAARKETAAHKKLVSEGKSDPVLDKLQDQLKAIGFTSTRRDPGSVKLSEEEFNKKYNELNPRKEGFFSGQSESSYEKQRKIAWDAINNAPVGAGLGDIGLGGVAFKTPEMISFMEDALKRNGKAYQTVDPNVSPLAQNAARFNNLAANTDNPAMAAVFSQQSAVFAAAADQIEKAGAAAAKRIESAQVGENNPNKPL